MNFSKNRYFLAWTYGFSLCFFCIFYTICLSKTHHQNKITTEHKNCLLIYLYSNISSSNSWKGHLWVIMSHTSVVLWVKWPLTFIFPDVTICCLIVKTEPWSLLRTGRNSLYSRLVYLFPLSTETGCVLGQYNAINHYHTFIF